MLGTIFKLMTIALVLAGACPTAELQAQDNKSKKRSFNLEKFLKRLDTNGNGKVDPGEIKDDRTRGFLKKSGADPSKPISIKNFSKQIKKQRNARENPRSGQKSQGFAVLDNEREEEGGETLRFAVSEDERAPVERARTREFSDGAKKMLDWVLNNYDKNKDGKIDAKEIKSGRWADPPASVSDTNKDGSLSRMELLVRYQKREDEKAKRAKGRDKSDSRRSRDRSRSSSSRSSGRSNSTSKSRSITSSSSSSSKGNRDVRKGYESYVAGLFKTYDKNKDGLLDKEEISGMRRKPDMKADENGDKKISKAELVESYLEKAGQGKKKTSRSRSSDKSGTSSSRSNSTRSGLGSPGGREPLTSRDKNKNGQIEMSEFASAWTLEKVEEFYAKDKNKDGVITPAEWNSK